MALVELEGSNYFRQRLVFSVLSGKPVKISSIRSQEENPGLHCTCLSRLARGHD